MKVTEIIQIVEEIRNLISEDFKLENKRSPKNNKELIEHVKQIYKNGLEDSILESLYLDDINYPEEIYKFILVASIYNYDERTV